MHKRSVTKITDLKYVIEAAEARSISIKRHGRTQKMRSVMPFVIALKQYMSINTPSVI